MDRKLLDALNNLSLALEEIAESLNNRGGDGGNRSATTTALQSGKLDKQLKSIDKGVKQLQSDNKKILKNQETIIALSKKKPAEKDPFDKASDPKQKSRLKDGLASIMMIAVGVLAIGMAFKLIGNVNFLSVIALAIALPLVAIAFEKIAKMKDLKASQMGNIILVTVAIATAITLSSFILSLVRPVGIFKLFTAIMIAGMFAVISYGIGDFLKGLKKANINPMRDAATILSIPIIMIAISLAIALSSYSLQLVRPVGIFKLFTAVMIAAVFGVIGFGLGKLLEGFKKSKLDKETAIKLGWMLPLVFIALSAAIAVSSWMLQLVKPVGIFKLFTAIIIAAMFTVLAYGLPKLLNSVKDITIKQVGMAALILIAITAAIVASSWLLTLMAPIGFGTIIRMVALSIALGISTVAIAGAIYIVNKLGTISDYIKGGLAIVVIATTIAISSLILSIGSYKKYPSPSWAIGVGLSLAFFGLGAVLLGTQVMNPLFYAGLGMVVLVAVTIVAVSYIFASGNYKSYPAMKWVAPVILILGTFAALAVVLGLVSPFLMLGSLSALAIAGTIWAIDKIFQNGKYDRYPSSKWTVPTLSILVGFASMAAILGIAFPLIALGSLSALAIVGTIWAIDKIFQKGKFNNFPSENWVKGVSSTITGFTKLMGDTSFGDVLGGGLKSLFGGGIDDVAKKIVQIDSLLSKGKYQNYPSKEWWNNIGYGIKTYVNLAKYFTSSDIEDIDMGDIANGMVELANGYSRLAESVSSLNTELNNIDVEKLTALKNLTGSVVLLSLMDSDQFEDMMDALEDKAKIFVDVINDLDKSTATAGKGARGASTTSVKSNIPVGPAPKTMDDLFNVMERMQFRLGQIVKSSDNLSKYVDEIRSSDISLKKKN